MPPRLSKERILAKLIQRLAAARNRTIRRNSSEEPRDLPGTRVTHGAGAEDGSGVAKKASPTVQNQDQSETHWLYSLEKREKKEYRSWVEDKLTQNNEVQEAIPVQRFALSLGRICCSLEKPGSNSSSLQIRFQRKRRGEVLLVSSSPSPSLLELHHFSVLVAPGRVPRKLFSSSCRSCAKRLRLHLYRL